MNVDVAALRFYDTKHVAFQRQHAPCQQPKLVTMTWPATATEISPQLHGMDPIVRSAAPVPRLETAAQEAYANDSTM